ncbi:MAG TPA: hypothetical protein VFF81_10160 [Noviherbaspirillum sp.]|nr:hypothetical protein [Noviherbaspirillum sp.]
MKFKLGQTVITVACKAHMDHLDADPLYFLSRHANGDWGEVNADDKRANEEALRHSMRILSRYQLSDGENIYIITEHDRSHTTIMLRSEY